MDVLPEGCWNRLISKTSSSATDPDRHGGWCGDEYISTYTHYFAGRGMLGVYVLG
jgi:hypothetical protein